jgi:hypothetical protein
MYVPASNLGLGTSVTFLRLIVAMLVVGVIAVATDAQALACEFVCARPEPGATTPHQHGSIGAMPSKEQGSHAEHMGHAADMHHAAQDAATSPQGLERCVTVNDVTLRATMTRDIAHPLIVVGQTAEIAVARINDRSDSAAIAGSPPARNGPLQSSSILRI